MWCVHPRHIRLYWIHLWIAVVFATETREQSLAREVCPRKTELIGNRECLKPCRHDGDCRARNKRCVCDDVCGKSCVNPNSHCLPPDQIDNGYFVIDPFNRLGAELRYYCDDDYILDGERVVRLCQGDKKWSGETPTCRRNAVCHSPPLIENGVHDVDLDRNRRYQIGTQISYRCVNGYQRDGYYRAMCGSEGHWIGPRMTCSPRSCGFPGNIQNGIRWGSKFTYPHRVTYECDTGYEIIGRKYLVCQSNGRWSRSPPICRAIRCPRLTPPENGNIIGSTAGQYNTTVMYTCISGYRRLGPEERRCQKTKKWTGEEPVCQLIECKRPVDFWNGYINGNMKSTLGSVIRFRCFGGSTLDGATHAKCLSNSEWDNPVPKCWETCSLPSIANGTCHADRRDSIFQGETVKCTCNTGHALNDTAVKPSCYNGSFINFPKCVPANCTVRPDEVKNGVRRYQGLFHGARTRYMCNIGYDLIGDMYLTCLYGEWTGKKPYCNPMYCPHPGRLADGKILLVGHIGKYDYRPYVQRIGQDERIEFQCKRGFVLDGPKRATCINGMWLPDSRRVCRPGRHPELPSFPDYHASRFFLKPFLFRFRLRRSRSVKEKSYRHSHNQEFSVCRGVYNKAKNTTLEKLYNKKALKFEVVPTLQTCYKVCEEEKGFICTIVIYKQGLCILTNNNQSSRISHGEELPSWEKDTGWEIYERKCENACLDPGLPIHSRRTILTTNRQSGELFPVGTQLTHHCNQGYRIKGQSSITCQTTGDWSDFLPTCVKVENT